VNIESKDMHVQFVKNTLDDLTKSGRFDPENHTLLSICADPRDAKMFHDFGLRKVTLSNLTRVEDRASQTDEFGFDWKYMDAQDMTLEDDSYDFVFVSAGLHHCKWPHRAVAEMYRVAKKGIIIFEARDSSLMRFGQTIGLVKEFELNPTLRETLEFGGLNGGEVPNFVYRWTEKEFEKTIRSMDPTLDQEYRYYYDYRVNPRRIPSSMRFIADPAIAVLKTFLRRQGNSFGMVAIIPDDIETATFPWLSRNADRTVSLNKPYVEALPKGGRGRV